VRIYLPDQEEDAPVITVSETKENYGETITNFIERVVAEVIHYHDFSDMLFSVVIEHHPPETADGTTETLKLVTFEDEGLGLMKIKTASGEEILSLGEPSWKSLGRESVEVLVEEGI
jgi:hypothetical protein